MFSDLVFSKRNEKQITLRRFCKEIDYDPSNWSKIERGLLSPPTEPEVLIKIAEILNIDLEELESLAYSEKGVILERIMNDEELLKKVPIFFIESEERLVELMKSIKENENSMISEVMAASENSLNKI